MCNLNTYLTHRGLIHKNDRRCVVICTHCHFDHAGGAHHFTDDPVYLHPADVVAVETGRQTATLNYVKPGHFLRQPYPGFSACQYRVPPTACQTLTAGQVYSVVREISDSRLA